MIFESWNTLGAVLAGGRSRRFGRDKARVDLGGETLLERAVARLRPVCSEVVLVSSRQLDWSALDLERVPDALPGRGPLAGITAAVRHACGRPTFVLACDLPFVSVELVRFLIGLAKTESGDSAGEPKYLAWVPRVGSRTQPLCGLYAPGVLPRLEEALAQGRLGVWDLLQTLRVRVVDLATQTSLADADSLLNVNYPRDLRRAQELLCLRAEAER